MAVRTMVRRCLTLSLCMLMAGSALTATESRAADCDTVPIHVETTDYSLPFEMPSGLMPDPQFDGLPAQLEVHRVRPVYADKCPSVPNRAVVLVSRPLGHRPRGFRPAVPGTRRRHPQCARRLGAGGN